jgi:hypothetical protein
MANCRSRNEVSLDCETHVNFEATKHSKTSEIDLILEEA